MERAMRSAERWAGALVVLLLGLTLVASIGVEGILLRARNESRLVISVDLLSQSVATR
jgi:hypothetical protein